MRRIRPMVSVAVLTALFLLPGASEAEFNGTLLAGADAALDISPETAVTGGVAVTVRYLNRKGNNVRDVDIATLTGGDTFAMTLPIRRNTSRVYIELDQSPSSTSQIRVTQGPNVITQDVVGDGRMVLDVVEGP